MKLDIDLGGNIISVFSQLQLSVINGQPYNIITISRYYIQSIVIFDLLHIA